MELKESIAAFLICGVGGLILMSCGVDKPPAEGEISQVVPVVNRDNKNGSAPSPGPKLPSKPTEQRAPPEVPAPPPGEPVPTPIPEPAQPAQPAEKGFAWIDANVFSPRCTKCHSGPDPKGDIDTSSYEKLMGGFAIVPGQPESSVLYLAIDSDRMPSEGPKLQDEVKKVIYDWIRDGAKKE